MIKELYKEYLEEKALYNKLYREYLFTKDTSTHNQMQEQNKKLNKIGRELYDALLGRIFEIEEGRFIKVEPTEYCDYEVYVLEQYKE